MSATGCYRAPRISNLDFFCKELGDGRAGGVGVIACTPTVRGIVYLAARAIEDGEPYIFGAAVETRRHSLPKDVIGENFVFRVHTESMGPWQTDCPAYILDLLTEPKTEWGRAWREKCRASIASKAARPKFAPGMVIKFSTRLRFPNEYETDTLEIVTVKPLRFKAVGEYWDYTRYRVPRQCLDGAVVVRGA